MSMHIDFSNESTLHLSPDLMDFLADVTTKTVFSELQPGEYEVSVLFCENDEIQHINAMYRNMNRATDVLSFPLYNSKEELLEEMAANTLAGTFALGDIIIAPDVVREAAAEIGDEFELHLARMFIHSVLHLLGYDHVNTPEEEEQMIGLQERLLEQFWKEKL